MLFILNVTRHIKAVSHSAKSTSILIFMYDSLKLITVLSPDLDACYQTVAALHTALYLSGLPKLAMITPLNSGSLFSNAEIARSCLALRREKAHGTQQTILSVTAIILF